MIGVEANHPVWLPFRGKGADESVVGFERWDRRPGFCSEKGVHRGELSGTTEDLALRQTHHFSPTPGATAGTLSQKGLGSFQRDGVAGMFDFEGSGLSPRDHGILRAHQISSGPTRWIEGRIRNARQKRGGLVARFFPRRRQYLDGLIEGLEKEMTRRRREGR